MPVERGDVGIPGGLARKIAIGIGFDNDVDELGVADILHRMIGEAGDVNDCALAHTLYLPRKIQLRFTLEEQISLLALFVLMDRKRQVFRKSLEQNLDAF